MFTPWPKMSRQDPMLEKDARLSLMSVAPTVNADGALAGEVLQASAPLSLPAATAKVTPEATALATAWSSAALAPPPRLMLATAGWMAWAVTQLMPPIT